MPESMESHLPDKDTVKAVESSVGENEFRIERAKDKRLRKYRTILESTSPVDHEVKDRQDKILRQLPEPKKLAEQLFAAIQARDIEYANSQATDRSVVQGELFEKLVVIENTLFDLSRETPLSEPMKYVESSDEKTIASFAHNPERYNFKLGKYHKADIDFVETDPRDPEEMHLKLIGVGEAKSTSLLDYRCFSQFSHFYSSMVMVSESLNKLENAQNHGLEKFGTLGKQIVVVPKNQFHQYLIVCRNLNITKDNAMNFMKMYDPEKPNNSGLTQSQAREFLYMIRNEEVEIRKSSFSQEELYILVGALMVEIESLKKSSHNKL